MGRLKHMHATGIHKVPPLGSAGGNCYGCHSLKREGYIATNMESALVGDVTLCVPCVAQLAKLIGYIPASKIVALKDANALLDADNRALKQRSDTLERLLIAMRGVVGEE